MRKLNLLNEIEHKLFFIRFNISRYRIFSLLSFIRRLYFPKQELHRNDKNLVEDDDRTFFSLRQSTAVHFVDISFFYLFHEK